MPLTDPPRALHALLAPHGLAPLRARCVSKLDCEIWRITPDRPDLGELALRIYPADATEVEAIHTEMRWLHLLAGQGLAVPAPLADRPARWLQAWPGAAGARHAVLLRWLPGRCLVAGLRPLHLRRAGELAARLHLAGERLKADGGVTTARAVWGPDLDRWADATRPPVPQLRPSARQVVLRAAALLRTRLQRIGHASAVHGFIHGDLHPWNLLFHRGAAGAIDFTDCGHGHHAKDLAGLLQFLAHPLPGGPDHRAALPELRDALFEGYAAWRRPPPVAQVDDYLVFNQFATLQWIVDHWPRPDLRPWGPPFLAGLPAMLRHWLDGVAQA